MLHIVTATSVGLESPASRPVLIVNDCAKMTGRHSAAVHKYLSQAFSPRKLLNLINLIKIYDFIFNMISCDCSYDRIQSYIQLAISVLLVLKNPVHMVTEVFRIWFPFRPISSKIIGNR